MAENTQTEPNTVIKVTNQAQDPTEDLLEQALRSNDAQRWTNQMTRQGRENSQRPLRLAW